MNAETVRAALETIGRTYTITADVYYYGRSGVAIAIIALTICQGLGVGYMVMFRLSMIQTATCSN